MIQIGIYDHSTGENESLDLSAKEIEILQNERKKNTLAKQQREESLRLEREMRFAILAKLGLTEDEAKILLNIKDDASEKSA